MDGPGPYSGRAARDALRIDTGATLALNQKVALFANLSGEISSSSRMGTATGGVRINW